MSSNQAPTHVLIHRYTPGTGPQEGTEELDAEMQVWASIDQELRSRGQLAVGWALRQATHTLGTAEATSGTQEIFAVHAMSVGSDAEAEKIAAQMPHLDYGSTEIHPVMS